MVTRTRGQAPGGPWRLEEMLLAIAVVFLQIVLEAYILGTLFQYIVKKDQAVEAFRRRLVMLEDYGAKRLLPMELRGRASYPPGPLYMSTCAALSLVFQ